MRLDFRSKILAMVAGSLLVAGAASATAITSTTYNGWKASLTGAPTELDFSPITYTNYNTSSGLTLSAVGNSSIQFDFAGPSGSNYSLTGVNYNGVKSIEGGSVASSEIAFTTPVSGDNALLLAITTTGNTPTMLTLSDESIYTLSSGLFGIALSHPITGGYLTTSGGSQVVVQDFFYGVSSLTQDPTGTGGVNSAAAPEGATMLLMAGGLLFVFGAYRKMRAAGAEIAA